MEKLMKEYLEKINLINSVDPDMIRTIEQELQINLIADCMAS